MEAMPAIAPLVLVLRGCIMGAAASASAPAPTTVPLPQAPAQIKIERADARVEIVRPVIIRRSFLIASRTGEVVIDGYRHPVRRRLEAGNQVSMQPQTWQLIIDLP